VLPIDIVSLLHEGLRGDRRPADGKLHCSSHLIGSLRHAMLDAAGAPRVDSELVSDIRLMTGTMWHRYIENLLKGAGVKVETEIDVTAGLPEGWSGTADWLFWHPEHQGWVLGDLKTTKGEGIKWIKRDGAKLEHMWQLSAYFWALVEMGFPMLKGFAVLYLPMNDTLDKLDTIEPTLQECEPIEREIVRGQMEARWQMTQEYLQALADVDARTFIRNSLAPEQDRVQVLHWNKVRGTFDVKLVPHWSAAYCPFPDDLCACSEQGTTKIGEYELVEQSPGFHYLARKGYEDIEPELVPAERDVYKRWKELHAGEAEGTVRPETNQDS